MIEGEFADDAPGNLVVADQVLPSIRARWSDMTSDPPTQLTVVSPFWPEGTTAAAALVDLVQRFQSPGHVELVCRSALSADGHDWLPEFDADVATIMKQKLEGRLFLRAALPHVGIEHTDADEEEKGDETEEHELGVGLGCAKVGLALKY